MRHLTQAPKLPPYDPKLGEEWMKLAIEEAKLAALDNEVPVGCLIFDEMGNELARSRDARQHGANPLAHAEWMALETAANRYGDWRLDAMTLVVTLEPCPMCAGAILMARVGRIIYGAPSPKWGAAGSRANWLGSELFPHKPEVIGGILNERCAELLSAYFKALRTQ